MRTTIIRARTTEENAPLIETPAGLVQLLGERELVLWPGTPVEPGQSHVVVYSLHGQARTIQREALCYSYTLSDDRRKDVLMVTYGDRKIQVIKVLRELSHCDLKTGKELAETVGTICTNLPEEDANRILQRLEDAGATVEVRDHLPAIQLQDS